MERKLGEKRQLGNQTTQNTAQIKVIVSIVKFLFSPSLLVSRVTKFDDDMVVASEEFEGGWVGTFFFLQEGSTGGIREGGT